MTPKQYEPISQIAKAKFWVVVNNNHLSHLDANIGESSHTILRLLQLARSTPQVISVCGMEGGGNSHGALSKFIKLISFKGVATIVGLRIFGRSPGAYLTCAQTIFDIFNGTQAQIATPFIERLNI